jgi:hypothetical protein
VHHVFDPSHEPLLLFLRIRIIIAQEADAVICFRVSKVDIDRFRMTDVQDAIRLRRKSVLMTMSSDAKQREAVIDIPGPDFAASHTQMISQQLPCPGSFDVSISCVILSRLVEV